MYAQNSTHIKGFFDPETKTVSYVIWDEQTDDCAIIDTVLDFDYYLEILNI